MTTHYECLGVAPSASTEEIRLAYLELARSRHPDVHPDAPEAERAESNRTMAAINAAWFVLRDADRRRVYDLSLSMPRPAPSPPAWPDEPDEAARPEWAEERWYEQHSGARDVTAGIARLWAFVLTAVVILLAALFTYAFVKSGSVGTF